MVKWSYPSICVTFSLIFRGLGFRTLCSIIGQELSNCVSSLIHVQGAIKTNLLLPFEQGVAMMYLKVILTSPQKLSFKHNLLLKVITRWLYTNLTAKSFHNDVFYIEQSKNTIIMVTSSPQNVTTTTPSRTSVTPWSHLATRKPALSKLYHWPSGADWCSCKKHLTLIYCSLLVGNEKMLLSISAFLLPKVLWLLSGLNEL